MTQPRHLFRVGIAQAYGGTAAYWCIAPRIEGQRYAAYLIAAIDIVGRANALYALTYNLSRVSEYDRVTVAVVWRCP